MQLNNCVKIKQPKLLLDKAVVYHLFFKFIILMQSGTLGNAPHHQTASGPVSMEMSK